MGGEKRVTTSPTAAGFPRPSSRRTTTGRHRHASFAYRGKPPGTRTPASVSSSEGGIGHTRRRRSRSNHLAGRCPTRSTAARLENVTTCVQLSLAAADSLRLTCRKQTTTHRTERDIRHMDNTPYADVCTIDCKLAMVVAARRRVGPSTGAACTASGRAGSSTSTLPSSHSGPAPPRTRPRLLHKALTRASWRGRSTYPRGPQRTILAPLCVKTPRWPGFYAS